MKSILILGAGKSATYLIKYLSRQAAVHEWNVIVADLSAAAAAQKIKGLPHCRAVALDKDKPALAEQLISESDMVLSMLPAEAHAAIAHLCIQYKKPFITASYVSDEISALAKAAEQAGIPILMEMGLDPGIDHMSAMKEINKIKKMGGIITSFRSYTGGVVAPESDNNPWHYKISWNPRNVVLAGQGTAKYLEEGKIKYLPYHRLFQNAYKISIPGWGDFEGYPNRDSLKYISTYGLGDVSSFIRGTLRRPFYCSAWDALVQVGLTDDSFLINDASAMSWREFTESFLVKAAGLSTEDLFFKTAGISPSSEEAGMITWLGIFGDEKISLPFGTPARLLQSLLETKWILVPGDKDMVVMRHELEYTFHGVKKALAASFVNVGENEMHTAMARTVGLPMGIAAKLILTEKLPLTGLHIPVEEIIYEPILEELKAWGLDFIVEEINTNIPDK